VMVGLRRMFIGSVVGASALALGGCVTTGTSGGTGGIVGLLPENIQSTVLATCGVILDNAALEALAASFIPGADTVTGIASGVCKVVTGRSGRAGATYRGVRLAGHYRVARRVASR
jgi:hypothetical protein